MPNILLRRYGTPATDRVLWATGIVGALAVPLTLYAPVIAPFSAFLMITVWVHGPASPFLPAAYEPVLMLFGRLYPPLLIGLVGTAGNLYIEFLDYHLFQQLGAFGPYRKLSVHPLMTRAVALFRRRPFLTVWVFAWSPLPDWMIRVIAPAAGYPIRRYLLAMGLGRLPRFWVLAAVGAWWQPSREVLLAVAAGATCLGALGLAWRRLRGFTTQPPPMVQSDASA